MSSPQEAFFDREYADVPDKATTTFWGGEEGGSHYDNVPSIFIFPKPFRINLTNFMKININKTTTATTKTEQNGNFWFADEIPFYNCFEHNFNYYYDWPTKKH